MTTDEYKCFPPLLSRCVKIYLRPYTNKECAIIARNAFNKIGIEVNNYATMEVARRAAGEARQVISYARLVYDYATVKNVQRVNRKLTQELFNNVLLIDKHGLQLRDIELLKILNERGSASIKTLASIMDEPVDNLKQRENLLINNGLINIGTAGRQITSKGRKYIKEIIGN